MKFSYLTIALFLLLILSCQKEGKAPISAETFTHILADMHTAEAATEGEFTTAKDSILKVYYLQILKKHGVSQTDFDSTMAVYSRKPIEFDSLYANVVREVVKIDTSRH
jgi:hypothetical protein